MALPKSLYIKSYTFTSLELPFKPPLNKISESGNYNLKIENNNVEDIVLFIQGITDNGSFISERIEIRQTK
jgi:hypothetical protein